MTGESREHSDGKGRSAEHGGDINAEIAAMEIKIHRGLWPLAIFLSIGILARTGFSYLPTMPEQWKNIMGQPPPPSLVNAAFVIYLLSAMVLSLTRMADQNSPGAGYQHVAYLTAFFGFYHICGVLQENYWAIIIGGVVVLTTEWYRNRLYYLDKILEMK